MKLVKGSDLTSIQVQEVKACFLYRLTFENVTRIKAVYERNNWDFSVVKLHTDSDWLAHTKFYIRKDGHIASRRHCFTYYGN